MSNGIRMPDEEWYAYIDFIRDVMSLVNSTWTNVEDKRRIEEKYAKVKASIARITEERKT